MASNEAKALRLLGVAPLRAVDVTPYVVETWSAPKRVVLDPPPSLVGPSTWNDDLPAGHCHHYLATIDDGIVFAKGRF